MRRPPSYSDSFLIRSPSLQNTPVLEPLVIPDLQSAKDLEPLNLDSETHTPVYLYHTAVIFILKGALHIFFISSFETLFYFLYVSASENAGIKNTIDAYYRPLVQSCNSWSNISKGLILDIINYELNRTRIDTDGTTAALTRLKFNTGLLHLSIGYSAICIFVIGLTSFIIWCKKIHVEWQKLIIEHLAFVLVLALYEYFFYITIIYKYTTVSTPELNQYIIDGLYQCAS
jgi:hypothetical protein